VLQRVKNEIARAVSVPGIYTHTYYVHRAPASGGRRREQRESQSIAHSTRRSAVRSLGSPKQPAGQAGTARQSKHNVQTASAPALPIFSLSLCRATYERERDDDETSVRRFISKRSPSLFASHPKLPARAHTIHHRARGTSHARLSPQSRPIFHLFCAQLQISRPLLE
jgi:hypothetical protein